MSNGVMEVKVYNNLTRKKETFVPKTEGKVKFYSCGPTTYDLAHIGNARAFVVGDLFNRILKALGYDVTFVRNFTDVDDKIIEAAKKRDIDPLIHSNEFIKECLTDMASLNLSLPTHTPKVSETIPEIIKMIQTLIDKGFAYVANDGEVLYSVEKFKEYGKLSKKDLDGLEHGIRVEVDKKKRHPSDFVLWKPAKPNENLSWDSPWGQGRPGWHIECSAMALKYLGETIDLHHGGVDLIFPHHENEIAQSEAANGSPFCGYWCHNEFLNFGKEKMSKSLGNVITIRAFVEKFGGEILRQMLVSVQYRQRMDWNKEAVTNAINDLSRIHEFILEVKNQKVGDAQVVGDIELEAITNTINVFKSDLSNDFNVTNALSHFFNFIRDQRRDYLSKDKVLDKNWQKAVLAVVDFMKVSVGCVYDDPSALLAKLNIARSKVSDDEVAAEAKLTPEQIEALIAKRKAAKASKDFKTADEVRMQLKNSKVALMDHPDGTVSWKYE